jgi:hypothetical protein
MQSFVKKASRDCLLMSRARWPGRTSSFARDEPNINPKHCSIIATAIPLPRNLRAGVLIGRCTNLLCCLCLLTCMCIASLPRLCGTKCWQLPCGASTSRRYLSAPLTPPELGDNVHSLINTQYGVFTVLLQSSETCTLTSLKRCRCNESQIDGYPRLCCAERCAQTSVV